MHEVCYRMRKITGTWQLISNIYFFIYSDCFLEVNRATAAATWPSGERCQPRRSSPLISTSSCFHPPSHNHRHTGSITYFYPSLVRHTDGRARTLLSPERLRASASRRKTTSCRRELRRPAGVVRRATCLQPSYNYTLGGDDLFSTATPISRLLLINLNINYNACVFSF